MKSVKFICVPCRWRCSSWSAHTSRSRQVGTAKRGAGEARGDNQVPMFDATSFVPEAAAAPAVDHQDDLSGTKTPDPEKDHLDRAAGDNPEAR